MKIFGLGIDYTTKKPIVKPMDEHAFGSKIRKSLGARAAEIRELAKASTTATTFRGEIERERTTDLGDPGSAGWTILVNGKDPRRKDLLKALRPLAKHRGMKDPESPLLYGGESPMEWYDWLLENYSSLALKKVPHYVLIAGGPDQVPFHFQSFLDSAASVGRVDFDSIPELAAYVGKVIRLEKAPAPAVKAETVFFAPDGGTNDPTYFSRRYMADPLSKHVRDECKFGITLLEGKEATKKRLLETLRGGTPALVYTASHGLGAKNEPLNIQKRFNGAICCQQGPGNEPLDRWLFSAEDVPANEPFLEGAVFFQFACYGYGTPAQSDYMHWLGRSELNSEEDFVAALPKRLLSHPRGPVGYIGHVDTAWLHGFDDPNDPHLMDRWHPRIEPYVSAVETLLRVQPTGLAMGSMNKRYDLGNAVLTGAIDRIQRGKEKMTQEFHSRLAQAFILRSDAQNYMVFGDPAVRLRIAKD